MYILGGCKQMVLLTVIITLFIHSLIGTIVFIATGQNDDFARFYATGIVGLIAIGFCSIVRKIREIKGGW